MSADIAAVAAFAALAASAALAFAGALCAEASAAPPLVRALEIRSDGPIDVDEVARLVSLAVGEPMDDARTRRTLRSLRYSGLASEVGIYQRPFVDAAGQADGVVAIVALWTDVQVTAVEVTGDLGLKANRLLVELPQRVGQPLREDRLLRGVYRLQDLLVGEGFLGAHVRLAVAEAGAGRAAVTYRVEAGARTRVRAVTFTGSRPPFADAELEKAVRSVPGAPFKKLTAADDVERLQDFLFSRGYREATVVPAPEKRDAEAAAVDLGFIVHLGPKIEFEARGITLRELEKKDLVPFLGDSGYDEALVLQSVEKIGALPAEGKLTASR